MKARQNQAYSNKNRLIFDWNEKNPRYPFRIKNSRLNKKVELNDETLRDGLQATYIKHPTLNQKIHLLELMEKLGIESANIGFPVSGSTQKGDIIKLINFASRNKLNIGLECGGRVVLKDVEEIVDVSQRTGKKLEAGLFIGSSKIRHLVEKWDLKDMTSKIEESISFAKRNNLSVMFVTEDTTRAFPKTIDSLYKCAINNGADRICVSDTVGHANPWSTYQLLSYIKDKIIRGQDIKLDWHGHNDRGLAVANSLSAAYAGADRIQATALGVGERAGNTSMVELIINLQLENFIDKKLEFLDGYARYASKILGHAIQSNYPIVGRDVFKTATGVHASAIKKALEMGDDHIAGIVYSAIDPRTFGREVEILIGPMSGKANVEYVLTKLNFQIDAKVVEFILTKTKTERRMLSEREVEMIYRQFKNQKTSS